jgi:5-methylcytosine-specific restriction endonuclease McrA
VSVAVEACPALVLNADFRPLSYFPLSVWSWQEAIKAVFLGRVNVVQEYERVVHSPRWEMRLPSVISLKKYAPMERSPAFTRFNVFLRDRFMCQYCRTPHPTNDLTFDHIIPRSKGGRTTWQNVVTACAQCNLTKGNRLPEDAGMYPSQRPFRPNSFHLQEIGRAFPPNYLHESWRDYLYWDSELEPW